MDKMRLLAGTINLFCCYGKEKNQRAPVLSMFFFWDVHHSLLSVAIYCYLLLSIDFMLKSMKN